MSLSRAVVNPLRRGPTVELGAWQYYHFRQFVMLNDPFNIIAEWETRGFDNANADNAWQAIAIAVRTHVTHNFYQRFAITMFPSPDVSSNARPRFALFTALTIGTITADLLAGWFTAMLQSDNTLPWYGTRIVLEALTTDDDTSQLDIDEDFVGWGTRKAIGFKHLPDSWHGKGISTNIHEHTASSEEHTLRLARNCGVRALLISQSDDYARCSLDDLLDKADDIAARANLRDYMCIADFEHLVTRIPDFAHHRIAVWTYPANLQPAVHLGVHWKWPEGQDRAVPDDNTLTVMLHQRHYYGIVNQVAFWRFVMRDGSLNKKRRCYACFRTVPAAEFALHECSVAPTRVCDICRTVFSSTASYEQHVSLLNVNYHACEGCGKTAFNGAGCFKDHRRQNCGMAPPDPQDPSAPRQTVNTVECAACKWNYVAGTVHDCERINVHCPDCSDLFTSFKELKNHRCPLARNKRYYRPLHTTKDVTTWHSHWAYDFETNRAHEREPGVYVHQVLTWAVQLMLPCKGVAEYVHALDEPEPQGPSDDLWPVDYMEAVLEHMRTDRAERHQHTELKIVPADEDTSVCTVRILGRTLDSFIEVVEHVLARDSKNNKWHPTLWAHNGSKFDAKFIFDYYVNKRKYEMAGCRFEQTFNHSLAPTAKKSKPGAGQTWKNVAYKVPKERKLELTNVGSRMLRLHIPALNITFKCSHAHHTAPLRSLPATFGLRAANVRKGEFPYRRLHPDNFDLENPGAVCETGLPPLAEYEVMFLPPDRRREMVVWWIGEQKQRNAKPDVIARHLRAAQVSHADVLAWHGGADPCADDYYVEGIPTQPWVFETEMWAYLESDVHVLARVMEAYHRKAAEMHEAIWPTISDDRAGKIVSPLDSTTAAGWAFRMYTTWFMPEKLVYNCKLKEHNYASGALRGGRTDKRANYVELTQERYEAGDRIEMVDVKSLYPSVQRCETYNTYFPTGHGFWLKDMPREDNKPWSAILADEPHVTRGKRFMQLCKKHNRTGFATVTVSPLKYSTHPVLHHVTDRVVDSAGDVSDPKLLFANDRRVETVYALPELFYALHHKLVQLETVHEALLYDRTDGKDGSASVFDGYVNWLYKLKDEAERAGNKGLYNLSKTLLNSLWGKLGQRSYPVREWVSDSVRLDYLISEVNRGHIEMLGWVRAAPNRIHFEYRTRHDLPNLKTTAPHLAAFVSMWGRLVLHNRLLREHGQRVLYYDTDSALIYMRPGDRPRLDKYMGSNLGDLADEVPKIIKSAGYKPADHPDAHIREVVLVAPKTYAIRVHAPATNMDCYKVVCKGFQPSWNNRDAVSFRSMKQLVWATCGLAPVLGCKRPLTDDEHAFRTDGYPLVSKDSLRFTSSIANPERVVPAESRVSLAITGRYKKGENHPLDPRLVIPFGSLPPPDSDTFLTFDRPEHHYV